VKLSAWAEPPEHFPRGLSATYASLGDFSVGAFPVEMSTAQAADIRTQLGLSRPLFEIIGLATDYVQYASTPREYAEQDYMGASTVWGPLEGPFLGCLLESAKKGPPESVSGRLIDYVAFNPGPAPDKPFGLLFVGEGRSSIDEELDHLITTDLGSPEHRLPYFEWSEEAPKTRLPPKDPTCDEFERTALRTVKILVKRNGKWELRWDGPAPDDDRGSNFITILVESPHSKEHYRRRWAAIWLAPLWSATGEEYMFHVTQPATRGRDSSPVCSVPFLVCLDWASTPAPIAIGECPKDWR
jgi:hypothetical protein